MCTAANGTLLLRPIIIPYTRYLTYWVERRSTTTAAAARE